MIRLFAAGAVLMAAMAASAEEGDYRVVTGNRLYEACKPNNGSLAFCDDFVLDVADDLATGRVGQWAACIPTNATDNQLVDAVRQFLETHPARRGSPAVRLVAEALAEAFPCK
jgi:hypothetical protein